MQQRYRNSTFAVLACATAFALTSGSSANTYYVGLTNASDSGPGSLAQPFATFGKAITIAAAGDTIFVRGGTYNLSAPINITKAEPRRNHSVSLLSPAKRRCSTFARRALVRAGFRSTAITGA
jgi:hypothetical protein